MSQITLYPTAGDGFVGKSASQGNWAAVRGSATGSVVDYTSTNTYSFITQNDGGGSLVYRGFFPFLLNLGSGAVITAATFSVMGQSDYGQSGDSGNITAGNPALPTELTTADFNKFSDTTFSTAVNLDFLNESYNDFSLNADGLTYLNSKVGAYATLCLRGTHDIANTDPGSEANGALVYYSEAAAAKRPKLVVTYTLPVIISEPFCGYYYH